MSSGEFSSAPAPPAVRPSTLEDFTKLNLIGRGSFGSVYRVVRHADQRVYALKQIELSHLKAPQVAEALNEVRLLASLDSPYIVRYFDSFLDCGALNLVMEYYANGDLYSFLKDFPSGEFLPEPLVWRFFLQLLLGVDYIHERKILHRDLKTLNLMIDADNNLAIGDLGTAKLLGTNSMANTVIGTPYYLSPELCEGRPYNTASDCWSLGIILYELCARRHPFEASNQGALILKIIRAKYSPLPAGRYSAKLYRIIDACLRKEPANRPSVRDLLFSMVVIKKMSEVGLSYPPELLAAVEKKLAGGKIGKSPAKARENENKNAQEEENAATGGVDGEESGNHSIASGPVASSAVGRSKSGQVNFSTPPPELATPGDYTPPNAEPAGHSILSPALLTLNLNEPTMNLSPSAKVLKRPLRGRAALSSSHAAQRPGVRASTAATANLPITASLSEFDFAPVVTSMSGVPVDFDRESFNFSPTAVKSPKPEKNSGIFSYAAAPAAVPTAVAPQRSKSKPQKPPAVSTPSSAASSALPVLTANRIFQPPSAAVHAPRIRGRGRGQIARGRARTIPIHFQVGKAIAAAKMPAATGNPRGSKLLKGPEGTAATKKPVEISVSGHSVTMEAEREHRLGGGGIVYPQWNEAHDYAEFEREEQQEAGALAPSESAAFLPGSQSAAAGESPEQLDSGDDGVLQDDESAHLFTMEPPGDEENSHREPSGESENFLESPEGEEEEEEIAELLEDSLSSADPPYEDEEFLEIPDENEEVGEFPVVLRNSLDRRLAALRQEISQLEAEVFEQISPEQYETLREYFQDHQMGAEEFQQKLQKISSNGRAKQENDRRPRKKWEKSPTRPARNKQEAAQMQQISAEKSEAAASTRSTVEFVFGVIGEDRLSVIPRIYQIMHLRQREQQVQEEENIQHDKQEQNK